MAYNRRTPPSHNKGYGKNGRKTKSQQAKHREVMKIKHELRTFARTEWGRKWVDHILHIGRPYRMQRGIRYAQENRIENLVVSPGKIFATVQGTAPTPYRVKIQYDQIPENGWTKILNFIGSKAKYIIYLLENRMPDDIEEVFSEMGYTLYPDAHRIEASCSCPDKEVPCKHIAATVLYISLVVDFNPFILLRLRGRDKDDILSHLKQARSCGNQPIAQSFKNIRAQTEIADIRFDLPMISAEDIISDRFETHEAYKIGFNFPKPTGVIETLDSIGIAPNLPNPEEFQYVLHDLYINVMKKSYKMYKKVEKKTKNSGQ